MTANPARVLGLDGDNRGNKGHIMVGGDADLLIVDDALRPWGVMARGRWFMREGEIMVRGTFDRSGRAA